ncbi:4380_t:CDS:2, partial [Scutellospora calospora]
MSKVNVIPIAITFSFMHLAILKERNTYHESSETYETDLQQKVREYKQYFVNIYSEWIIWRKNQISKIPYNNKDPQVFDTITNKGIKYEETDQNEEAKKRYEEMCNRVVSRYLNEAKVEFMKMYLHTFALDKFLNPKAPTIAPNRDIGTIICGIYGRETFPDKDHDKFDHNQLLKLYYDKPGIITGINIHAGYFVDCIKVKYKGYDGTTVGNDKGGDAYTIRGLNGDSNYVTKVDVYFNERVVSGIQFFFSNEPSYKGNINNVIGNGDKNPGENSKVSCGPIGNNNDFKLVGIQMAQSKALDKELGDHELC